VNGLTKILIVLLTVSSLILCGLVANYVSNAQNYRQEFDNQKGTADRASSMEKKAKEDLRIATEDFQAEQDNLNAQIEQMTLDLQKMDTELQTAKLEKTALDQKVQTWVAMTRQFTETNKDLKDQLGSYIAKYEESESLQIRQAKELDETQAELIAKLSVIDTLEDDKKALEEEVGDLRSKLDGLLMQQGRVTTQYRPIASVTPPEPTAPAVPAMDRAIDLKGTITSLKLENSLAQISIGGARGVRVGMQFFVTRGPAFICKIQIIDVQPEMAIGQILPGAAGNLPRVGDSIATNL
jgi:hypothetical protein